MHTQETVGEKWGAKKAAPSPLLDKLIFCMFATKIWIKMVVAGNQFVASSSKFGYGESMFSGLSDIY